MNREDAKGAKGRREEVERLAAHVVDAALAVHRELGPGLLESAYGQCFRYEIASRGLEIRTEVALPIQYREILVDGGYRLDALVENLIVVEHKVVEVLLPFHSAQLLTYLKLGGYHLGFLLNWNVRLMKDGIVRLVNNL